MTETMANQLRPWKKTELHKNQIKPVFYPHIQTTYLLQLSPRETAATCPEWRCCPVTITKENVCLLLAFSSVPSISSDELVLLLSTISKNTQILILNISFQLGKSLLSKVNFQGISWCWKTRVNHTNFHLMALMKQDKYCIRLITILFWKSNSSENNQ